MIEFRKDNDEVILSYSSEYPGPAWVYHELDKSGEVTVSRAFTFTKQELLSSFNKDNEDELIEMGVKEHSSDADAACCRDVILEELNFDVTAQDEAVENIEEYPGESLQPAVVEPTINEALGESDIEDEFGESDNVEL